MAAISTGGASTRGFRAANFPEEIVTEGDRQMKELLQKQLCTSMTLQEQLTKHKDFAAGSMYKPGSDAISGQVSLEDYSRLLEDGRQVDELRQFGLTDEEIALKLKDSVVDLLPQSGFGVDPNTQTEKLAAIEEKIFARKRQLDQPTRFAGAKVMSRQEMDLEQAISKNRDRSKRFSCLLTDGARAGAIDPNHPINRLDEIWKEMEVQSTAAKRRKRAARKKFLKTGQANPEAVDVLLDDHTDNSFDEESSQGEIGCKTRDECLVESGVNPSTRLDCFPSSKDISSNEISQKSSLNSFKEGCLSSPTNCLKLIHDKIESVPAEIIERHRLDIDQIRGLPRFTGYNPGEPSKTLFLKNLSPRVTETDLVSLFIRFQKPDGPRIVFRLLTGKMKGQAFVTFDSAETANCAFQLVNGYDFRGKNIIIEFGKNKDDR